MEKEVKEKKATKWIAVVEFRDSNDYEKVYQVGDEVEHTAKREELKLIEKK